jgi:NADH:ubiquinone oxidoreductase subunit K
MSLLGIALLFAASGAAFDDVMGQIMFFLLLTLAGVESALGLALVILYYRIRTQVRWSSLTALKG